MDMERTHQITRERITASQEQAVRDLVRTNAMLEGEVEMLRAEARRLQAAARPAPCRTCADEDGGPRATGDDGLCDGCRGARTLEKAKVSNKWMRPDRSEPYAALSDGTPLLSAYHPPRRGERFCLRMGRWNGATGEWVGVTLDGRLFRQQRLWGNDSPRPDRWEEFRLGW
jgi:hypothetical protein